MYSEYKKPVIHFLTNHVTMNDVANVCIASGGRPIMADAIDEFETIIASVQGLVINIGTADQARFDKIYEAFFIARRLKKPILLDPVGCSASLFRLNHCLKLLKEGVTILKCNGQEARALVEEKVGPVFCGVDSQERWPDENKEWAQRLWKRQASKHPDLIVIVTGAIDYIVSAAGCDAVYGGSILQQRISGAGCMLNSLLITHYARKRQQEYTEMNGHACLIKALGCMNRSSEIASRWIHNQSNLGTYKQRLIDEIAKRNTPIYLITPEMKDEKQFTSICLSKTEEALRYGVAYLQYRVKNKTWQDKLRESRQLQILAKRYGTTFIINDDIKLAQTIGADGVHLGIHDVSIQQARKELGDMAVIGATAKTLKQAQQAFELGADYLGVGALFPSPTKKEAIGMCLETLQAIYAKISLPLYGIGGITAENLTYEQSNNLDGIAMVSGIYQNTMENIGLTIKQIKQRF